MMITTLNIKNIGIINNLTVDLNEGFNVLTGETGAGKSLIIDSLEILCGGRFLKEMIRKGETHSYVEASIYSSKLEDNIIVTREIYLNGRNTCKINGRLVTVNELKNFMNNIIDIHGQNDNQKILNTSSHIEYLDLYIGKEIYDEKEKYLKLYQERMNIKNELKNNFGDKKEKQRQLDLLKYQNEEILNANLKIGEEEELECNRRKMINSEKVLENIKIIDNSLSEKAIDAINEAIRSLEKIENIDEKYTEKLNCLKNIYYDIQELSRDISGMSEDNYFDEEQRQITEERLDQIFSLKRKYGNSIEEILMYNKQIESDIEKIENSDEYISELETKLNKIENQMRSIAKKMNDIRLIKSKELSCRINSELQDLEMKKAEFQISIREEEKFNVNGLDNIEFLIKTNVGDEFKPLIKIASGGEMSRIMLAIKTVLADVDEVPVIVFDEIDTGISGKASKAVSEKMKIISNKHQILCITHNANIAAKADYNYLIYKKIENDNTETNVKLLNEDETINEIARISSGELTQIAIEHAKEMRKAV